MPIQLHQISFNLPTSELPPTADIVTEMIDKLLYESTNYVMRKSIKKLRFEYSEKFTKLLEEFTKENMNEDRKTFKIKWIYWKEENQNIYDAEIKNIKDNGYEGNPHSKIFESVRYYYRKKQLRLFTPLKIYNGIQGQLPINELNGTTLSGACPITNLHRCKSNQEKNQRTEYIPKQKKQKLKCLSKTIIQSMDKHIKQTILEHMIDISPASTYSNFCETNIIEITREIFRVKGIIKTQLDPYEIEIKFKKAYKNRFYKYIKSIQ